MRPNNPFLISGYHSPDYFCDRKEDSKKICHALHNGRDVTLMAARRMGKTGLIKDIFYHLREQDSDIVTIYLDIYSTQNLREFIRLMASSILGQLDNSAEALISRVVKFIKSCRPSFTLNEVTGMPTVTLDVVPECEEATLKEIFDYLGSSERRCYVAIDEFQQISEYPQRGVEALLRSYIQFLPNVNFIFAGSKQHVMQEMFLSAKRPFYQSTQPHYIDRIDCNEYFKFASRFFNDNNCELSRDSFNYIYELFEGHTWYVQSILNRVYSYNLDIDKGVINSAIGEVVDEASYSYQTLLSAYSSNNVALIRAIAKEGVASRVTSNSFIIKYKLGAASSVKTSINKLIDKELVYRVSPDSYIVYDRFMAIWLKQQPY